MCAMLWYCFKSTLKTKHIGLYVEALPEREGVFFQLALVYERRHFIC